MTGAQLKAFLTNDDHVWPAAEEVSGKRLALIKTVGNAILNNAESSPNIDTIMDTYGRVADNIPDPSGLMINRLYGEIEFSVMGPGGYYQQHLLDSTDLYFSDTDYNYGIIGDSYSVFSFGSGSDVVTGSTESGFRIGQFYNFTPSGPNNFIMSAGASGGGDYLGFSTSGSIIYTECELTTRSLPLDWFSSDDPSRDWPIFIEVAGTLNPSTAEGQVESGGEIQDGVIYSVQGSFTKGFTLIDPDSDTLDHLEDVCEGGYFYLP